MFDMNMIIGIVLITLGIVILILLLYNDLNERMKNLYEKDYHNTLRPKVDILCDKNIERHKLLWDYISKNEKNIGDHEKEHLTRETK